MKNHAKHVRTEVSEIHVVSLQQQFLFIYS